MLQLALTGPHGVGKTTLIKALEPKLASRGRVAVCREAPRLILNHVGDPEFFRRGNNSFSRQAIIFLEHLMEERRSMINADVVLSDRTLVDHLAYTVALFPEASTTPELATYQRIAFESLENCDAIFRLPIEFASEDDGVREADPVFQRLIEKKIVELYNMARVETILIRGSVEERVAQIEKHLAKAFPP